MKKTWTIILILGVAVIAIGYRFQPQENQTTFAAADASTACQATLSDYSGSTDATADLACQNTGDVTITAWNQATIFYNYVNSAGTAIVMQCDISPTTSGADWYPIMRETANGAKYIREWTVSTTASGNGSHNFEINAERLRCRFWVTGGDSGDTIGGIVRKASEVGDR